MAATSWQEWHKAYDEGLAARAAATATDLEATVDVRQADASVSDEHVGQPRADLLLLCGIFGNVSDADVETTVRAAAQLCAAGAEVIWTRHTRAPDLTPTIRGWFADAGFDEVAFVSPDDDTWSVGVHRLVGEPAPLQPGRTWFRFFDDIATGLA